MRVQWIVGALAFAGFTNLGASAQEAGPFSTLLPRAEETLVAQPVIGGLDNGASIPSALEQPINLTLRPQYLAADSVPPKDGYRGGRGLVTLQGMSGMFLNPTSGTLNQGQLTIQYCLLVDRFDLNSVVGHGLMAAYGVTDWLELGLFGTVAEINGVDRRIFDDPIGVAGPFARIRLLKEDGMIPEVSIGGIYADGSNLGDILYRMEGFVAASKLFTLDPDGTLRSLRVHAGLRYCVRSEAPAFPKGTLGENDFFLGYGGLELELPYSLFLIGELSTNNLLKQGSRNAPFAAGVQWKPNNILGISLAYTDPVYLDLHRGLWFGIGLNFQF